MHSTSGEAPLWRGSATATPSYDLPVSLEAFAATIVAQDRGMEAWVPGTLLSRGRVLSNGPGDESLVDEDGRHLLSRHQDLAFHIYASSR